MHEATPSSGPRLPTINLRNHHLNQDSHAGCGPFGGYFLPSFSILGSHVHLSSSGIGSMTMGTWLPHPHQVDFSLGKSADGGGEKRACTGGVLAGGLLQVSQLDFLHMAAVDWEQGFAV
ncbi:hypothetical protein B0A49_06397 [Cryomyces minteri]|uniref:Uncharacterized protein n=1 Tax=Cryomyces minteri TaxID=331657 RepID=A0A4U0WK22_9PEZI|nr:hypothetical protein B0A49_06397 [Cryomyces minteri]